jgi:tetratricopeptide (TPR) repeat protein
VFSSKSRSPYTQMYLTHIDQDGNDSPAILVENSTAANRAVNIPEFVDIAPGGLRKITGPAIEYYRLVDSAEYFRKRGRYRESLAAWTKVLEVSPDDAMAHNSVGNLLLLTGRPQEAAAHLRIARELRLDESIAELQKVLEYDPGQAPAYHKLGLALDKRGKTEEALRQWQKALEIRPAYAEVHNSLGNALHAQGKVAEALAHWREGIRLKPDDAATLTQAAWVLATCPDASIRNGSEATALAERAVQLSGGTDAASLDTLGAAYAEAGRFTEAVRTASKALALAKDKNQSAALQRRIALYETSIPFRQ